MHMNNNIIQDFWTRNSLTFRAILVGFLILVLLIPAAFIGNLVHERAGRQKEVQAEVSSKWAGEQTITGPLVVVPYLEKVAGEDKKVVIIRKNAVFLPEKLLVNGKIDPQTRYRSIFKITVYDADISLEGDFPALPFSELRIAPGDLLLDEAVICFGLSDFKGIREQVIMDWGQERLPFNAGLPDDAPMPNGLMAPIHLDMARAATPTHFSMSLKLKGSEHLFFTPVGKTTEVHLNSPWANPSFDGEFLPEKKSISGQGFTADWKVLHLNRNYPQAWKDGHFKIMESAFGPRLYQSSDGYAKTERSVKYALLFIMLTFLLYFFIEILQKKRVHPLQYVLVGMALCVFYLLLLSLSEYIGFNGAYAIAATAIIMMVTLYTRTVFRQWKVAVLFGAVLAFLYTVIFILIQLQDWALLFGSIGLFVVLALVMYFSRKLDWYVSSSHGESTGPETVSATL
jgi:inner membrane protein